LKVGGVRQTSGFRKSNSEDKTESAEAAVTSTQNALNPQSQADIEALLVPTGQKLTPAIFDAVEGQKTIASTYNHPQPKHDSHKNIDRSNAVQAPVRENRQKGFIQQPGGAYGAKQ